MIKEAEKFFEEKQQSDPSDQEDEANKERRTVIKVVRYMTDETVTLDSGVFGITIAAYITGNHTWAEYFFCIRTCMYVAVM
jgi:hypothetical protein